MTDMSFDHLGLAPKMVQILDGMKITTPMPIQHKAIPLALSGQDVVGIAQTGTGKTLAFGIPLIQRLSTGEGRALVLVPTRELALQVDEVLRQILPRYGMKSVVIIGGASMHNQIQGLRKKPRVLIATPGRLIDHLMQKTLHLKNVSILVLDEADRMFDMGFAPQVNQILKAMPNARQNMLFSATMPPEIINLATRHMKLPIHVEIAPSGTTAERVRQELFIVKEDAKKTVLKMLLSTYRGSILLFTRTKIRARRVTMMLQKMGQNAAEIHSDRTMGQRKKAIEGFKSGQYRILVATDIAARGIDVSGIELVINYDLPDDSENYVHRIGRTARAGHEGCAVSLATPDQGPDVGKIEKMIRTTLTIAKHPDIPTQDFLRVVAPAFRGRKRLSFRPGRGRSRSRRR